MDVRVGLWRKLSTEELMLLNCDVGERRLLRVPRTARIPNQSILKEISPGCWNSSTLATSCEELTHWKRLWCCKGLGAGGKGGNRGWDAGWHHQLNGRAFWWTPGVGDRQGGLACCSSWCRKELDTTEWLSWTELITVNRERRVIYETKHGWELGYIFNVSFRYSWKWKWKGKSLSHVRLFETA